MNSKFGQIRPMVSMATEGLQWEKRRHHVFSNVFDQINFILAGNDDIHKSLNGLKIRRDPT